MAARVSILLPRVNVYPRLGGMLMDAFHELGWQPTVRHGADAGALEADVLLLAGLCRKIDGLPALLRQRRQPRPVTLLWQLEPLPPAMLSPRGEEVGARMAACEWTRIPRPLRKVLNVTVPFRSHLMRALRRWLARAYTREAMASPDQQGWLEYSTENFFNAMAEWRWIKSAHGHGGLDHCFASNQPRVRFLRSRGIAAEMIPVGYHPEWGRDRQMPRDIEVLFLGKLGRGPRHAKLAWVRDELERRGRKLTLLNGVYGSAREELLSRTRIMLSLLRVPHDQAGMRILIGFAGGALVVSEACADTGEYLPGKHFVTAPVQDLPAAIEHYLDHAAERETIAAEGHRFATKELTLANVLRRMLALAAVNRPT